MGWSCRADASLRFEAIMSGSTDECSNTWHNEKGVRYMYEIGREHEDGAITGQVYKFGANNTVTPAGSLRIEGDGTVTRFPSMNKKMREWARMDFNTMLSRRGEFQSLKARI